MKNLKLELEKVYKNYCDVSLIGIKGEDEFVDVLYKDEDGSVVDNWNDYFDKWFSDCDDLS